MEPIGPAAAEALLRVLTFRSPPAQARGAEPATRGAPQAAILTPDGLLTGDRLHSLPTAGPPTALEVFHLAARMGLKQIWVSRGMAELAHFPASFPPPTGRAADKFICGLPHPWLEPALAAGWAPTTKPPGLAPWLSLERAGVWLDLVIPRWDESNPFGPASSARVLLEALDLYGRNLGIRFRFSAGRTGLQLMRAVHEGPRGLGLPEGTPCPPAVEGIDSEAPGLELARQWPAAGWLHLWDLNGMYLAACSSAELGFGEAVAVRQVEPGRAGYWRARISKPAGELPPLPLLADGRPHWYTAPALELAHEAGCEVAVSAGWAYPERHRWLEPWYARLRDARTALAAAPGPAGALARSALKGTYTAPLGALAGRWKDVGDPTFRPDWRDTVIARARANFWRHLRRVQEHAGRLPVLLSADTAGWVCEAQDPGQAADELGLVISDQLGKWKHAGRLEAAQASSLVAAHRTRGAGVRAILEAAS